MVAEWNRKTLISLILGVLIGASALFGLFWFLSLGVQAIISGNIEDASAYGSLIVGLATLLLVFLTAGYAYFTREQVKVLRATRNEEHERQLHSLRRGLRYEIDALLIDRIESMGFRDTKQSHRVASRAFFETNADRIGLLSDSEVDAILTYYWRPDQFEDYLLDYSHREGGGNIQRSAEPLIKAQEEALNAIGQRLTNE